MPSRLGPTRSCATILSVLVLSACGEADGPVASAAPVTASLEEVFAFETVVQLGEDPADSIAEVGDFVERRDGGFVIADRLLPRVRSYDGNGQLEAAFGRFGEGPFEFRRVNAVAETPSGRIVVADFRSPRLTYLTSSLSADTLVPLPSAPADIVALGPDLLVWMIAGDPNEVFLERLRPPLLHRVTPQGLEWSSYEHPFTDWDRPYWSSFVRFPLAVSGDSVYAMSGLRFPVTILNSVGDTVGTVGTPSASFRPLPIFELGAFTDLAEYGTTLPGLLASADVIDRIDVVGTHLVLTRARFDHEQPFPPFRALHSHLDIYDRHTGVKLYEDIPLPAGSKVLGGGRFLYVLLNKDIPPWQIAKLRIGAGD